MNLPADELELGVWTISRQAVRCYLESVDNRAEFYAKTINVVPPMFLLSTVLKAILEGLSLPPGTIHLAQEFESNGVAIVDERISCVARLSRPIDRGDWKFMAVEFKLDSENTASVLTGRCSVLVPYTVQHD